ncbi:hypothetical protein LCGC14_2539840 [marine sediment metagenome]|uniref:Uncharacterized protein n=1 Tax=marine sediment metagenome TaxID=412755 RepID=A0A0F9BDU2_9ZZZZ
MKSIITQISITQTSGTTLMAELCPSSLTTRDFLQKIAEQLIAGKDSGTKDVVMPGLGGVKYARSEITSFTISTTW